MPKYGNTILKKNEESLTSVYQFWMLGGLILIGNRSMILKEANGITIWS